MNLFPTLSKKRRGDVTILVSLFMVAIMLTMLLTIISNTIAVKKTARYSFNSQQAYAAANSGIELWLYNFRNCIVNCTGSNTDIAETNLDSTNPNLKYSVTYSNTAGVEKITAYGNVYADATSSTAPVIVRSIEVEL